MLYDYDLLTYFEILYKDTSFEQMHAVLFSDDYKFISIHSLPGVSTDMVDFDYRQVMNIINNSAAKYIVLAHPHFNYMFPSTNDIIFTHRLNSKLAPKGIVIADHIIVFNNRAISMKSRGYLKF